MQYRWVQNLSEIQSRWRNLATFATQLYNSNKYKNRVHLSSICDFFLGYARRRQKVVFVILRRDLDCRVFIIFIYRRQLIDWD